MNAEQPVLKDFLAFSSVLTGFQEFDLLGTGQAQAYLEAVIRVVGEEPLSAIGHHWRTIAQETTDPAQREARLRREVLGDPRLGPIARNIIKLWYVATWYQLPTAWREAYGVRDQDVTFVVSPAAYPEGLLWKAIGANPPGAKGPGYGTWASPPQIPPF